MNRLTMLATIMFTFLICAILNASTSEDTTDVENSILQSVSQHYQDYLGYQSSTVEMYRNYSTNRNAANTPELHFLGGEYFNHDIVVNGLSFRNPITGVTEVSFASAFFNDINIYKGNIPVQFSNANSAVIELSSPLISTGYHGSFEMLSDNIVGNKFDQNYYRGIFSGSLFNNNNLNFWSAFERKWLGDRLPSSLTSEVLAGSPDVLPNNQLSGWTYHGKLQFELSKKSLFTFTADGSTDEWQEYRHYFNNPSQPNQIAHTPRYKDKTYGINALLEHKFSENTQFNLSVGYYKSERLNGDGVLFDDLKNYVRDYSNPEYDMYSLFREGDTAGSGEFYEAYYSGYQNHISSYKQIRAEVNKTCKEIHQIKTGLLYKKYTLRYYNNSYATVDVNPLLVNRYGFDIFGNESDDENWRNDAKQPTELSLYFSDVITLDNVKLHFGVRYDRFDYNSLQLRNPHNPLDLDFVNAGDIILDESDMVETKVQTSFNPQVGLDIAASDNMNIYVDWSQNHQAPPYGNMYLGWDSFEQQISAGLFTVFVGSSLEPVKSQTIIVGVKSKLNDRINLDANISNVEYKKQIVGIEITPSIPFTYNAYSNLRTSSYLGLNFSLQYDNRKNFTGFIDITKSKAEGNNISLSRNILWNSSIGFAEDYPLNYDRTLKIVAGASFKTNFGLKINLIAKQESGYPYTPMLPYDAIVFLPVDQNPIGSINSVETDKNRVVDLKLEKDFNFSKHTITAFILVKNLLDEDFITGVYPGTGSPTNTGFLDTPAGRQNINVYGDEYADRYNFAQQTPLNFYPPRQIFFGIKTSF